MTDGEDMAHVTHNQADDRGNNETGEARKEMGGEKCR